MMLERLVRELVGPEVELTLKNTEDTVDMNTGEVLAEGHPRVALATGRTLDIDGEQLTLGGEGDDAPLQPLLALGPRLVRLRWILSRFPCWVIRDAEGNLKAELEPPIGGPMWRDGSLWVRIRLGLEDAEVGHVTEEHMLVSADVLAAADFDDRFGSFELRLRNLEDYDVVVPADFTFAGSRKKPRAKKTR